MKTKRIVLRVSYFEKMLIKGKAKELGLSISEYIRVCSTNKLLPKPKTEKELEVYNTLKSYHTNFRRISNLIREKKSKEMLIELEIVMNSIKHEINKW